MHEAAACTFSPAFSTLPPCLYSSHPTPPPSPSPCPPRNAPLPILPPHTPALRPENYHPFRKFGLGGFGSASSPTAAWPGRTGTTFKRHKVIPAPITKSEPLAIQFKDSAEVPVRLGQIGDQVFALAITDLIQKLYPHLRVGYASVRQMPVIRNRIHLTSRLSRKSEIA